MFSVIRHMLRQTVDNHAPTCLLFPNFATTMHAYPTSIPNPHCSWTKSSLIHPLPRQPSSLPKPILG